MALRQYRSLIGLALMAGCLTLLAATVPDAIPSISIHRFSLWTAVHATLVVAGVLLLVGAVFEIRGYQLRLARVAALEERRRIARDLHDGLAQELAFIVLEGRRLAARVPDRSIPDIVAAARRGLDESRGAIARLTADAEQPLEAAVEQEARTVAARGGAHVTFTMDSSAGPSLEVRDAVLRIVREAITNATRHGKAEVVRVELSNDGKLVLRVADDGRGFDPAAERGRGFGLQSMRERVEALGGNLRVESRPGAGTTIEAIVP